MEENILIQNEPARVMLMVMPSPSGTHRPDDLVPEFGVTALQYAGEMTAAAALQPVSLSREGNMEKLKAARPSARILIAEDNIIDREISANRLQSLGYAPDAVENGVQAVEAVRNNKYDVVLMGCRMPEMDGFEATAAIRSFEGASDHTIIIAVTANALPGDRRECLAAGMDDYLSKPVKAETLRLMLDRWTASAERKSAALPAKLELFDSFPGIVDSSALDEFKEYQKEGEPDLVSKLIDLYIDDTHTRMESLTNAFISGDSGTVKMQAHTIKGASGNVGAIQMAAICDRIYLAQQLGARTDGLIAELEEAFKNTTVALNSMRRPALL